MANGTTALPQYDAIRQRLKSQYTQQRQDQTDAIQRRFAANGMSGSGAYGKAQDQANADVSKQEAEATSNLDFAEANELQRRKELEEGRQFQTSERLGSQAFQTSERAGAQQFNEGMFNKDLDFKKEQFGEQKQQFAQEFAENQKSNRVSALANLVGDDIQDYNKVKQAQDRLNYWFGDGPEPAKPTQVWVPGPYGWGGHLVNK
jgi:hypothetical protein